MKKFQRIMKVFMSKVMLPFIAFILLTVAAATLVMQHFDEYKDEIYFEMMTIFERYEQNRDEAVFDHYGILVSPNDETFKSKPVKFI